MAVGGVAIDTCTACLAAASQSWARQPFQKVRSCKKLLVMPTTAGFLDTLAQHVLCPFRGPERPLGRWTENTHTHTHGRLDHTFLCNHTFLARCC